MDNTGKKIIAFTVFTALPWYFITGCIVKALSAALLTGVVLAILDNIDGNTRQR